MYIIIITCTYTCSCLLHNFFHLLWRFLVHQIGNLVSTCGSNETPAQSLQFFLYVLDDSLVRNAVECHFQGK